MEKLEKVELVREKCSVSYEDAREALEACDYDVLDAIVWLERSGKSRTRTTTYETPSSGASTVPSQEMAHARQVYEDGSRKTKVGKALDLFLAWLNRACRAGLDTTFVAERSSGRVLTLPVLVLVVGIFFWGATIWLLVAGLFFGFRYHFEGKGPTTIDMNDMMDKAAEGVESIKREFQDGED